ncbi:hypothetical protein SAMN02745216_00170 [Desulfatibacillum alkenivorans DSM 16219]|jgi:hypothetical protein|uniref:Uncharacterized protein n=1 Tax=Desulfatibacillum alkenivorans DSM 16219 TaxID=1121393 RepID=A0A1M6C787_9BACT|nr:hypothetical protein [Desulfatibacillum alkenivorans]SHI56900.1 hypothetical protein SAMN02745216_00170 [Desulfatibacillum alkenivorans DSM 16219]
MTPNSQATQAILRDPSNFQWYIIPLLLLVLYVYANEVQHKRWSVILGGLALWGMDWFNEIWNSLFLHFTNFAPCWGLAKNSCFIILTGLNIEICFMFAIMGIVFLKQLPEDKDMKILGVNNRWFMSVVFSLLAVFVEILLNLAGALVWEWGFWNIKFPVFIFLLGYFPFFVVAFKVHDMENRKNQIRAVLGILGFDLACLVVFGGVLGWI